MGLTRTLAGNGHGIGFLLNFANVREQPFHSLGFTSVLIVTCLFVLGLPLVLL